MEGPSIYRGAIGSWVWARVRRLGSARADSSLTEFVSTAGEADFHALYPLFEGGQVAGTIAVHSLNGIPRESGGRT